MKNIRIGIVGLGNMGRVHAQQILDGKVARVELTALCDSDPRRFAAFPRVPGFATQREMFEANLVDAVLIATPHYAHTSLGIEALERGVHVMMEKPISVHRADAERLLAAHRRSGQVFAAMFNQRTDPTYATLRRLVQTGELGEVRRINWTVTNWFRTAAYYASAGWRATWKGEGGGVLLNQCPHNLDLLQWLFGQPVRVQAHCRFGRYHAIEVEDEVTAYLEFAGGATGVFITSTGEAPGTNRLEVAAERGRVVVEDGRVQFTRNETPMSEFSRTARNGFAAPPVWHVTIPVQGPGGQHNEILRNFADAIIDGVPLIAPAAEGLHSVELANAMLLSTWNGRPVDLPINAAEYERQLLARCAASTVGQR